MMAHLLKFSLVLSFFSLSLSYLPQSAWAASELNKNVWGIYMIGSDLEDGEGEPDAGGAGSGDLMEIIKGYQTLSPEQQESLDIYVAFGGADQEGWHGIKYANVACLIKDSQDETFGNDTCYDYQDENADMGEEGTLQDFLNPLGSRYQGVAKKILTFWNHGSAYMGLGPDTSHEDSKLQLDEIQNSLLATKNHVDLIGFDACLMGSLGTAQSVKNVASYMIASEEMEPEHGWDYTAIIEFMGQNPKATIPQLGQVMIDSFIDSPNHEDTDMKTLSLLDLSQTDHLIQSVDQLVQSLDKNLESAYQPVLNAVRKSEDYGKSSPEETEMLIDLKDFAIQLKTEQKDLAPFADRVLKQLQNFVVFNRTDGTKPKAGGVAIFSLKNNEDYEEEEYDKSVSFSPAWFTFVIHFMEQGLNDDEAPEIQLTENPDDDTFRVTVSDNVGYENIYAVYAVDSPSNSDEYIVVGLDGLIEEEDGSHTLDAWDGKSLYLCNGECQGDHQILVPTEFENEEEDGSLLYSSNARLNKKEVSFFIEMNSDYEVVDYWATPYKENKDGEQVISREQLELKKGDTLTFYHEVVNQKKDESRFELGQSIQIKGEVDFEYKIVPGAKFYFVEAEDLNGNLDISDLYEVDTEDAE